MSGSDMGVNMRLDADPRGLESGVQRAKEQVGTLGQAVEGLGETAIVAGDDLASIASTSRMQSFQQAAGYIRDLGTKLGELGQHFTQSAERAERLSLRLSATFAADQVEPLTEAIRELGATPPFSGEQFAQAAQALNKFGVEGLASAANLTRLGNVAAATGNSVEGLAQVWGNLARGGDDARRSILELSKQYGISGSDLAAFGASVDHAGKLLVDTPAQAEAARQALERLADSERFAGSMDKMASSADLLRAELDLFSQDIGKGALEAKNFLAEGILPLVKGLRALPTPIQAAVGIGTEFAGVAGNVAGQSIQAAAHLKALGLSASSAGAMMARAGAMGRSAMMMLASPIGIAIAAVAALAYGFHSYTEAIKDATAAQEELLKIEEKRAKLGRENKDLIGKTAEQVLAMGKTEKDVVHAINLLHEQAQAARAAGNDVLEEQIKRQITDLQRVKVELSERAAVEAKSAGLSVATWEDYSKRVSAGFFETKSAQLQALDAVIAAQKRAGQDTTDAELSRVALFRQVAEEKRKSSEQEASDAKKAAEDRLGTALHALKLEDAAGRLTDEQKAARLRGLLASYRETAIGREKLRDLELEASKLEGQAAKKAEEEKRSAAAAALASKLQAIDMERARASSTRNLSTQEEVAFQQRVVALHKQGTSERAQAEIALYNLKARLRQEEESALQRLRALEAELVNARTDEIDDQIADLQDKMAAEQEAGRSTAATHQAIVELLREKLAIQLQMIEASTRERMEAEKDPRVKAKLAEVAEKKKADARRDSEREIRRADEAQKKRAQDLVKANQDVAGSIKEVGQAAQDTRRQVEDAYSTMSAIEWTPAPQASDELTRTGAQSSLQAASSMTDEERYETPRQARERRERMAREREEALQSQREAAEQRTKDRESRVAEDASERKRAWEESWRPPGATPAQAEGQPLNTMTRDQGDQLVALLTQIATNTKTQGGSGGGSLASRLGEASYFSAG